MPPDPDCTYAGDKQAIKQASERARTVSIAFVKKNWPKMPPICFAADAAVAAAFARNHEVSVNHICERHAMPLRECHPSCSEPMSECEPYLRAGVQAMPSCVSVIPAAHIEYCSCHLRECIPAFQRP